MYILVIPPDIYSVSMTVRIFNQLFISLEKVKHLFVFLFDVTVIKTLNLKKKKSLLFTTLFNVSIRRLTAVTFAHIIRLWFLVKVLMKSTREGRVQGGPVRTKHCGLRKRTDGKK